MFVVGGSYKSFYINQLHTINKIDLLIFQQNIFYDFDYEQEYSQIAPVSNELIMLNKRLNCPIIVYGYYKLFDIRKKCFIVCVNGKVSVIDVAKDVYLYIKGKLILISNKMDTSSNAFAKIVMTNKSSNWNYFSKNLRKNYFICTKTSVMRFQGDKIYRKFRKYCYFSLCFYKKML